MIKPDIIVTWPRNADYPVWRQMIRNNRHLFNEVIIVFMETNQGDDYREFVRQAMFQDHVLCVESPTLTAGEDWRNVAVNAGLLHSLHSEWIWFTEQDFFPKEGFFQEVEKHSEDADVIYVDDGGRMHPCCIFIKRETLAKTKKQFGANPPEYDHFGQLTKDLWTIGETEKPVTAAVVNPGLYNHMAGLSHNLTLVAKGDLPNYKREEFEAYLWNCLRVNVPLPPNLNRLIQEYFYPKN